MDICVYGRAGWGLRRSAALAMLASTLACAQARAADRVAVLTFDDASASHARHVGPLLKEYGFGATFFVGEYPGFEDKTKYLTWEEIASLHAQGFEIGNHTLTHRHVDRMSAEQFVEELGAIEQRCAAHGIPRPVSFAYPAYATNTAALAILRERGYRAARTGGGRAWRPAEDDPLLIPSVSGSGADTNRVIGAFETVKPGEIVVVTFHGVPDLAHPQVSVPPATFKVYLDYLREHHFKVRSLRDALAEAARPDASRRAP